MSAGVGATCPSCREPAVISLSGDIDCLDQRVCEACGLVVEDSALVYGQTFLERGKTLGDSNNYNSLPVSYYVRNVSSNNILGISVVKQMGSALTFTTPMIEETRLMFERVHHSGRIKHLRTRIKETAVIACLYIVGRMHSWPLATSSIASASQRRLGEVLYWVRAVTKLLGLEITTPDVEELVPLQIREWGLPESLRPTAIGLIQLLKSTWIAEGMGTDKVIKAVVYVSYDAYRCKQGFPRLLSPKGFADELNVKCVLTRSTLRIVRKAMDLLFDLGTTVPWIGPDLSKKRLLHHLDDILTYQKTLLHDVIRRYSEVRQGSDCSGSEDCGIETPRTESTSSQSYQSPSSDQSSHACALNSGSVKEEEDACGSHSQIRAPANSGRKRKLTEDIFTPSSYRDNRQKSREDALKPVPIEKPFVYTGDINSIELSEHDLTDKELKEYLRGEDQITVLNKLYYR